SRFSKRILAPLPVLVPLLVPVVVLFLVLSHSASAQRNIQLTWPTTLHVGASLMQKQTDSITDWSQNLGSALTIQSGIGFRFKNKFGLQLQGGGILQTYTFASKFGEYDVSLLSFLAHANGYFLIPIKTKGYVQVGSDLGYYFHGTETLVKNSDRFSVVSQSTGGNKLYYSPEIGLSGINGRIQFSLLATYTFIPEVHPIISTTFHDETGQTSYETKGNYLGLKFQFTYSLWGNKEPQNQLLSSPPDAMVLQSRETKNAQTITTSSKNLVLFLSDNAELDGDSISVVLNGEYVMTLHELRKDPYRLKLRLKPGANTIGIQAHNEGRISPNTMKCILRSGRKKYELTLSASLESNTSIEIIVQ
ncbi:MAG: hypothetical protein ACOYLH_12520, partial [Flavobacteriales bacterium]